MQMGTDGHERITIETERILIIAHGHAVRGWCETCGREVDMRVGKTAGALFANGLERFEGPKQDKPRVARAKNKLGTCLKSLMRFLSPVGARGDCSHQSGGCGNETESKQVRM